MSEVIEPIILAAAEQPRISRRGFLRAMSGIATGAFVASALHEQAEQDDVAKEYTAPGVEPDQSSPEPEEPWSYRDDIVLAGKILGAEIATGVIGQATGLKVGNAGAKQIMERAKKAPFKTATNAVVVAPAIEELVFRAIPSTTADFLNPSDRGDKRWALGTLASIAFAAAHNISADEPHLPLPQFVGGLGFWYAQRRGGYNHATVTHAANNALPVALLIAFAQFEKRTSSELTEGSE